MMPEAGHQITSINRWLTEVTPVPRNPEPDATEVTTPVEQSEKVCLDGGFDAPRLHDKVRQ